MTQANEVTYLPAARAGNHEAFQQLTDPYRHELVVHCYRILGSLEDAEDMVQETLLRAWRRLDSYEGRASFRAWLYKIATNASLDALDSRRARLLPNLTHASADPNDPFPEAIHDPLWLDPLPDSLLHGLSNNPEARYEIRESVSLAFLAALQELPGRQRAVLILRDVLDWSAREVADLLDVTVIAVNSLLQRARETVEKHRTQWKDRAEPASNQQITALLVRYLQAWETADSASLVALLRDDAILTMPPLPLWYRGRAAIKAFLDTRLFADGVRDRFRLLPAQANGSPAFAVYERDTNGLYRPSALQVLSLQSDGQIVEIQDFLVFDHRLFARFGLPATLET